MVITVLFYTFVVTAVVQLCYYISFTSLLFHKTSTKFFNKVVPVSIIVYAKNNAQHLTRLVPLLQEQEYKNYEAYRVFDRKMDLVLNNKKQEIYQEELTNYIHLNPDLWIPYYKVGNYYYQLKYLSLIHI